MNTTHQPSHGELLVQYHYAIMANDTIKIQAIKNQILDKLEANSRPITQGEIERRGFENWLYSYSIDSSFGDINISEKFDMEMHNATPGEIYMLHRFVYAGFGIAARLKNKKYPVHTNYKIENGFGYFDVGALKALMHADIRAGLVLPYDGYEEEE
ncbi:hypothetical protein [Entomobacter blattae]|uniref:Uncharacterized protein n=1 Tax=Entomobacter blattae TaxID=2762277 RepID=A0A7H1NU05_9PROT|nr:hypothetical protein [Entomobacter blattae]QNT79265.1 hypothetical protein JGUZn3_20600 [Entomobacter blattae]